MSTTIRGDTQRVLCTDMRAEPFDKLRAHGP
jgi:hypothetical protein